MRPSTRRRRIADALRAFTPAEGFSLASGYLSFRGSDVRGTAWYLLARIRDGNVHFYPELSPTRPYKSLGRSSIWNRLSALVTIADPTGLQSADSGGPTHVSAWVDRFFTSQRNLSDRYRLDVQLFDAGGGLIWAVSRPARTVTPKSGESSILGRVALGYAVFAVFGLIWMILRRAALPDVSGDAGAIVLSSPGWTNWLAILGIWFLGFVMAPLGVIMGFLFLPKNLSEKRKADWGDLGMLGIAILAIGGAGLMLWAGMFVIPLAKNIVLEPDAAVVQGTRIYVWHTERFDIGFNQIQSIEYEQKTDVQSDAGSGGSSVYRYANVHLRLLDGTKFKLDSGSRASQRKLAQDIASAVGVPLRLR